MGGHTKKHKLSDSDNHENCSLEELNALLDGDKIAGIKDRPVTSTADSYNISESDEGKTIWMNNDNSNTVYLPTSSSIPINFTVMIMQEGAGITAVEAPGGVLNGIADGSVSISGKYKGVTAVKRSTSSWVVFGGI